MERHFGIECNNFDETNLREINQFVEANPYIFIPLESTNDGIHDKDDNHPLVPDVDPKDLINIVKFDQRKGKAPGYDTITQELLRFSGVLKPRSLTKKVIFVLNRNASFDYF